MAKENRLGYIAKHLPMLRVECDRCGRKGRYRTDKLLEKYGVDATLQPFQEDLTRDCPHKQDKHYPYGKCFPAFSDLRTPPANQRSERKVPPALA
jgi:hypothetical protein